MKIDVFASERHFVDHLMPVYKALPRSRRGDFVIANGASRDATVVTAARDQARTLGLSPASEFTADRRAILVSSYGDMKAVRSAGRKPIALIEHGIGQSYTTPHPSFPGGKDRGDIGLFLSPNETAAARDRTAYPDARVVVVGSPRLDLLLHREGGPRPVIAISSHWDCAVAPESRSALFRPRPGFAPAIAKLATRYQLIGHGHPRAWPVYERWYRDHGIEPVEDLRDVFRRADLYVCDNSSSMYEFAATGRPVVVLNSPIYRRRAHHGLRFWDAADVGIQVDRPAFLEAAIEEALVDPPERRAKREAALDIAYGFRTGAAKRAVDALLEWSEDAAERPRHAPTMPRLPRLATGFAFDVPTATSGELLRLEAAPATRRHPTIVRLAEGRRTA